MEQLYEARARPSSSVAVGALVGVDSRSHCAEGVLLAAVYVIL